MKKTARWLLIVCFVLVLAGLGFLAYHRLSAERAAEAAKAQPTTLPSRVGRDAQGRSVLTLSAAEQSKSHIQVQALIARELEPQVQAIGILQEDPAESFTLRSPIAGTLRTAPGEDWPRIGDVLRDGTRTGTVEPRFAPFEQIDLSSKLAAAQADAQAATASLLAARAEFQRLQALNAQNKNVSDKAVQDARATLAADEAKLAAAEETVKVISSARAAATRPADGSALTLSQSGQVVELTVRPGETVEAGQALLRVARFDALIAAVGTSPGEIVDLATATAQVRLAGRAGRPIAAGRIEIGPAVDPKTLGATLLLHLDTTGLGLRPGMPVTARLIVKGKPQSGVLVPAEAVVWQEGQAWVFVRAGDTQFIRTRIDADRFVDGGYFVTGLGPSNVVVTQGAQLLLSEEFKPELPPGGAVDND